MNGLFMYHIVGIFSSMSILFAFCADSRAMRGDDHQYS